MDPDRPSLLKRVIAIAVIALVVVIALRLAVGFIAGLIAAVFWIAVILALVVAFFWARSTLRRGRRVGGKRAPEVAATPEDKVAAELRRLNEQLREQGRL